MSTDTAYQGGDPRSAEAGPPAPAGGSPEGELPDPACGGNGASYPIPYPGWMLEDLARSGIPPDTARDLNWVPVSDGYMIPFYDPATAAGAPLRCPDGQTFERKRLKRPGANCKYLSPKNGGQYPFILPDAHQALTSNPGAPVIVTEGEKKAVRAALAGVGVIGIPGIDTWSEGRGSTSLHPLLGRYVTEGRPLVMIYDSDGENPEKADAFNRSAARFATAVEALGGQFLRVFIPAGPNGERQGLDDWLQAGATGEDLLHLIEQATPVEGRKDEVRLPGGTVSNIDCAREVASVLARRAAVFTHGGELVTLGSTSAGTVVLEPLGAAAAASELERHIQFMKCKKEGTYMPAPLPEATARMILASPEFRSQMPAIRRVCNCRQPCFDEAGRVVLPEAGYDESLGIYTNPDAPSLERFANPEEAVSALAEILADFCFLVDDRCPELNYASAIAYLLSDYCRLLIEPERCPLFLVVGNRPGLGKDYLLGIAPVLTTGELPDYYAPAKDSDESRKRLFAIARGGLPFYILSNLRGHVDDAPLEAASTSPYIADRVLGGSTTCKCPNTAIYAISANDLTYTEDLSRRCIRIRLGYFGEDVNTRSYSYPDLYAHIQAHRPRYLGALQALVDNWQSRGCPSGTRPKASFTKWAKVVGGILEAAGILNPIGCDSTATEPSEEVRDVRELLSAWHEQRGGNAIDPNQVRQLAMGLNLFAWIDMSDRAGQTKFAAVLKRHEGRNFGGLVIRKQSAGRGHTTWSCGRAEA